MTNILKKHYILALFLTIILFESIPFAHAHRIEAQHGTINIVNDGAYIVLSLPVSAFTDIDDDADSKLSVEEFNKYRLDIVETITHQVLLSDKSGNLPLEGIMLSPVTSHAAPTDPVDQIMVMGRFSLNDENWPLNYQINLYGEKEQERSIEITASSKALNLRKEVELTPDASSFELF